MLAIVDYGVGNLKSILNLCHRLSIPTQITGDAAEIQKADLLILPGVGHFSHAIQNLKASGLIPVLEKKIFEQKTPLLGLCVGMQLFAQVSEEGEAEGLGWLDADIVRFRFPENENLRIPHVGFNTVERRPNPIFKHLDDRPRFYFTHSYHMVCRDEGNVLATTHYGHTFPAIVQKENIVGTQFHPEKSHQFGLKLIRGFAEWGTECSSHA